MTEEEAVRMAKYRCSDGGHVLFIASPDRRSIYHAEPDSPWEPITDIVMRDDIVPIAAWNSMKVS